MSVDTMDHPDDETVGPMVRLVESLIGSLSLDQEGQITAARALAVADRLDTDTNLAGQTFILLSRELADSVRELSDKPSSLRPRLGALRGDEAETVARLLGSPNPEAVDVEHLDSLFELTTTRRWRLGQWEPPVPPMQVAFTGEHRG